ncbi:MAG: EscU/YscU/HrcU family type III secretion system export apparatus switch protein [Verrucomicrobiota bacterium]
MEDKENKNLPASAKKRQNVREQGSVVKSQDLNATILLAVSLTLILLMGKYFSEAFQDVMRNCIVEIGNIGPSSNGLIHLKTIFSPQLILLIILFLVVVSVVILIGQVSQAGLMITPKAMAFKLAKFNPVQGFKKLFGMNKVVQAVLAVAKMAVVTIFAFSAFAELSVDAIFMRPIAPMELGGYMVSAIWELGWRVILALIVLSIIDYSYQKYKFEKDIRMSRYDMKEELKQQEGNPQVKKKIRRKQMMSLRRMIENMADTTIVITNPTHYAVGLRYVRGETQAPVVMAKGKNRLAMKLKEKAIDLHIPTVENVPLARGLYKDGEVGYPIPADYYRSVASVIALLQRQGYAIQEAEEADV